MTSSLVLSPTNFPQKTDIEADQKTQANFSLTGPSGPGQSCGPDVHVFVCVFVRTLPIIRPKSRKGSPNIFFIISIISEALTINPTNFLSPPFDRQFCLSFNFYFGQKTPGGLKT